MLEERDTRPYNLLETVELGLSPHGYLLPISKVQEPMSRVWVSTSHIISNILEVLRWTLQDQARAVEVKLLAGESEPRHKRDSSAQNSMAQHFFNCY